MLIRKADPADSFQLSTLTALAPMEGAIRLGTHRQPDFFGLLRQRGPFSVWIAEEDDGSIVGSFSATKELFHIRGEMRSVTYLGDLRVHPRHQGGSLAFRLVRQMHRQLVEEGADLLLCTAAEGNSPVMDFFEGRAGIPAFTKVAAFRIHQLLPRRCRTLPESHAVDKRRLTRFFDGFYAPYTFRPVIEPSDDCRHFIAGNGRFVKAAVSVFDPSALKQNVLLHCPWTTALTLTGLRILKSFLPLPAIPAKGSPLKILFVKYLGYAPGRETELRQLLQQVRGLAFDDGYHLVSIAIHEKDRLLDNIVTPLGRFVFRSYGLMSSLRGDQSLIRDIAGGIVYEDFSLL